MQALVARHFKMNIAVVGQVERGQEEKVRCQQRL